MSVFALSKPVDIAIYAVVGGLCWYLTWWTLTRYDVRGIRAFGAVLALEGVWAFNSAAKLLVQDVGVQMVLARTDVVMLLVVPLLWFRFASEYLGKGDRWSRGLVTVGALVAALGVTLTVVSPTGTVWTAVEVVEEPFVHLHPIPSRLYLGVAVVAGVLFAGGFVRIVEAVLTTRQTTLAMVALSIGMTFPAFFMIEYVLQIGLFHQVNYTSMGVGAFMIMTTAAVFSDLFAVNPIPRERILANVNEGVLVLDDRHRVVDYNDRLLEYFVPAAGTVIGETVDAVFPAIADGIAFVDGDEAMIAVERPGEERHFRLDVAEIRQRGSTMGWDVVATDVTALQRQQRELRRQNEQLDRFASTVSHDLRNPLNVAELALDLARQGEDDQLPAAAEALERMEAIIEDLLALAREGQAVDEPTPVDVESVAAEAWSVTGGGGSMTVGRNDQVLADRDRLRGILENLFRNAVEHAGPDVNVTVTVTDGRLVVEDDGAGIPRGTEERVFEYGFSTVEGGTGLGLAIVETMAHAHGWEISAGESDDGGAKFVISGVRLAGEGESDASPSPVGRIPEA